MLSYDELFDRYCASRNVPADRARMDALVLALYPCVRTWASDVLETYLNENQLRQNHREDLIQDGFIRLLKRLPTLFARKVPIRCGKHLVYSLRKSLKREMKQSLDRRFVVPFVTAETIKKRVERGEPEYKSWELRHQIAFDAFSRQHSDELSNRTTATDPRLFAREDDRRDPRRQFIRLICEAAVAWGDHLEWQPYAQYLLGPTEATAIRGEAKPSQKWPISAARLASLTGLPQSTFRRKLQRLSQEIATTAPFATFEDGKTFLGKSWCKAAQNDPGWHSNSRGLDLWTPWRRLTALEYWRDRFAA